MSIHTEAPTALLFRKHKQQWLSVTEEIEQSNLGLFCPWFIFKWAFYDTLHSKASIRHVIWESFNNIIWQIML